MGRQDNSGTHGSRPGASGSGAGSGRNRASTSPRNTVRRPARKPGTAVYRRRRLFVGAALLLVIAARLGGFAAVSSLLNAGAPSSGRSSCCFRAGNDAGRHSAGHGVSLGHSDGQRLRAEPRDCHGATDKPAYAAGENPLLTLKVTNGNRVPCEVNIGTSQMEFLVTSGSDRIFSSTDCQADAHRPREDHRAGAE